jgi:hypothetical protein
MAGGIRYAQTMRMYMIFIGCVVAIGAVAQTQVYESVGSDGVVEFTDQPSSSAKSITVTPNVVTMPESPAVSASTTEQTDTSVNEPTYTTVSITAPKDDEAIRSNAGNFAATAVVEPGLLNDDKIQWLLDGEVVPGATTTFLSLRNVDRGTHSIVLQVVNTKGDVVKSSETVTFHLLRFAGGGGGP